MSKPVADVHLDVEDGFLCRNHRLSSVVFHFGAVCSMPLRHFRWTISFATLICFHWMDFLIFAYVVIVPHCFFVCFGCSFLSYVVGGHMCAICYVFIGWIFLMEVFMFIKLGVFIFGRGTWFYRDKWLPWVDLLRVRV